MRYLLLSSLLALGLTVSAQIPDYVPTDGLIAWYPFDGNANDESGNGFHGDAQYTTATFDRNGVEDAALKFNGMEGGGGSSVVIDHTILNVGQEEYTIHLWFRPANLSQISRALFNTIPHTGIAMTFNNNNSPSYVSYLLGPADAIWDYYYIHGSFNDYQTNGWYALTLTKQGSDYKKYLNGVLESAYSAPLSENYNHDVAFRISGISADVQIFDGDIDDVGFWNRALTQQEVFALHNEESSTTGCTNENACNYDPEANVDDGSCLFDSGVSWGGEIDSEGQLVLHAFLEEWNEVEAASGVGVYGGFGSHLYLYTDQVASWSNNKTACEQSGAQLASVLSEAENNFIKQVLFDHAASPGGAHIGASDDGTEGSWYWLDGSEWNYSNWSGTEPNNSYGGEHFGQMYSSGFWNDCRDNSGPDAHIAVCKRNIANRLYWGDENNASVIALETPFQDSIHLTLQSDLGSCVQLIVLEEFLPGGITGCLDTEACNFSSEATFDDGSCHFLCEYCLEGTVWSEEVFGCIPESNSEAFDAACMGDLNADGIVDIQDLLDFFQLWGDECQLEEEGPLDDTDIVWSCGDPLEYQGYDYETVQIGEQCWFAENLRIEDYRNGDEIPVGLSDEEWSSTTSGAVAVYGEGSSSCNTQSPDGDACDPNWSLAEYGRLYNWYAVNDMRGLCPSGWHVPSDDEWITMEVSLGMNPEDANATGWRGTNQGAQLKATSGWLDGGNGSNVSGFSATPGGNRDYWGAYYHAGTTATFWTETFDQSASWVRRIELDEGINRYTSSHPNGWSVRCIRDSE